MRRSFVFRSAAAFTLVELMVVMFIVGLIVLSASPYLRQGIKAAQSNAAARDFYTDLAYARSLAIKTGLPHLVEVCPGVATSGGTFTAVPGYMVIECSTTTGSGATAVTTANFSASQCTSTNVCAELANDAPSAVTGVRREVNLLKGGHEAQSNADTAIKQIAGVTFGVAGSGVVGTPDAPSSTPPTDGVDLGCPGASTVRRRFFFQKNGQAVDDSSHAPCGGTYYITSNMELASLGASGDTTLDRAVEFTSAGGIKVYRWDTNMTGSNKWR